MSSAATGSAAGSPGQLNGPALALREALQRVWGSPVEVADVRRLSGGASRETWSFIGVRPDGERVPLILRRDPPGRPGLDGSMAREAAAMRATRGAGLSAPEVLLDDDGSVLGTAGLVMELVPGETLARRILRDEQFAHARTVLSAQLGSFFAGLHRIDPGEVPGLLHPDPLETYRLRYAELGRHSPTFELAFRWLAAHRPATTTPVIVHGDLRLGNVIVGPEGLTAVIDWELVHLGEPLEDLGWLCVKAWRFGSRPPVAGVGQLDDLIDAYEQAGGAPVDRGAFHWWLVMNTLKWGIGCMGQAAAHLTGAARSVELAAIGRRVCEQEWDLIELLAPEATAWALAQANGADTGADEGVDDGGLHGHPTAAELLEAAREYLTGDVLTSTEGRVQFHARVASNVLAIVERELQLGPAQRHRYEETLASLGVGSAAQWCARISTGEFDQRADELHRALAVSVRDRVAVANPRHLTI